MSEAAMSEVAVIPRRNASPSSQNTSQSTPPSAGRILIIDDEAEIRGVAGDSASTRCYTVVVAGTGREGLAHIGERAFDVVLLDLALPDKNGRRGRDLRGGRRLRGRYRLARWGERAAPPVPGAVQSAGPQADSQLPLQYRNAWSGALRSSAPSWARLGLRLLLGVFENLGTRARDRIDGPGRRGHRLRLLPKEIHARQSGQSRRKRSRRAPPRISSAFPLDSSPLQATGKPLCPGAPGSAHCPSSAHYKYRRRGP